MTRRGWTGGLIFAIASTSCASSSGPTSSDAGASASSGGYAEGNTFPDLSLTGYLDKNNDGALTPDEYGPVHPSDVLAANPKAEVLLVHVAFGWCKYCWEETAEQIKMTKGYAGRFVSVQVLVQDRNGDPATQAFQDEWLKINKSAMPTTLEPEGTLFKKFGRSATYLMLDPKEMKVLVVGAGPPTFGYVKDKIAQRLGPLPQG